MDTPGGGKDGSGPAGIREFRPWRLVSPVQWGVSTEHGHAPANIIQIQNSNTIWISGNYKSTHKISVEMIWPHKIRWSNIMIHSHNFPKELKCAQNCRNVNMKEKNPLLWEETRVQRRPGSSLTNQNVSSDLLQRGEYTLQCINMIHSPFQIIKLCDA